MNEISNQLNSEERSRLKRLMDCIDSAISAQNHAGEALLEISEARLYRESHSTLEAFVKDTWGFSRPRAYQLIDAGKSSRRLSTIVDKTPEAAAIKSEAQHRELKNVSDEHLPGVIEAAAASAAADNRPITARHIKAARELIESTPLATTADMAEEGTTEEYEDVDESSDVETVEAKSVTKPEPTKAEHLSKLRSVAKQYNIGLMRTVDEMQSLSPKPVVHERMLERYRGGDADLGAWK